MPLFWKCPNNKTHIRVQPCGGSSNP